MQKSTYPLYLGGHAETPNHALEVLDKYSQAVVTRVALADEAIMDAR